ncbi:TRAP transporter small permease [Coraliomargarita akajimensis]|uniref:Tripartite ATP-independent periplasmic transporter DctQ component n=1 Tax=Coraliomargarita akajimensis (strain DSM 45221 / IAM 15411 / JCM 23193 / KCTC 12865 / 04OKA010-24) TaxID=583355 RepID=D5EQ74_CORAD|nr:TRAP transporter small permease [Coraliomargarita akajimensis]ADE53842.1 Tripartite ATP-independent periplasmic transporter DctQ component [Coraliomargarita akajimensis DSM 45221]
MNQLVHGLRSARKGLTRFLEWLLIGAVFVLVIDVLWGVFSRYALGDQSGWTEELARMLLIQVALLGSAAAFGERAHLGVDFFTGLLDSNAQRLASTLVYLLIIFFGAGVLVSGGLKLVARTFELQQQLMAIGIPKGYIYLCVPISGIFIVLVAAEQVLELWLNKEETA